MKIYLIVLSVLYSSFSFGQETRTIRGSLVDTTGKAVTNAIIVLMNRSDSTQLKLDYFQTGTFEMKWADKEERDVMLYISAIGYNSRYLEIDKSCTDLGEIVMMPLSVYMEEVTVSTKTPIGHKFDRGRDEYTIPEWLAEQSYDLNSLLALIPGLVAGNGDIRIAGIGKPAYLINGLPPRNGELENLNPKDIEKVTIIRMPGAKYGKEVIGLINIETKKAWHDYLSVRLKNDFDYKNEVNNTSGVSVNFKKDKLSHFLNYNYSFSPKKNESLDSYETKIPDDNIYYLMSLDKDMYERSNIHSVSYSPKYQFNKQSFIDVQYLFNTTASVEDNFTRTSFADGSEPNLMSRSLADGDQKTHYVTLRYDNKFGNNQKSRLTFNTVYMRSTDNGKTTLEEESSLSGRSTDTMLTLFRQAYRNDVLTSSLDGKFTLWEVLEVETGASYGNLWTKSGIDYYNKDYSSHSRSRNEQVKLYLNTNHSIGEFSYQLGLRGEYERRHGVNAGGGGKNAFYFLPTAGAAYRVSDELNFMLYYRRMVDYPTTDKLSTNILYFNQYMYNTGNPYLKPTVSNSLMANLAFPFHLALTCQYFYKKNDIYNCTVTDEDNPNIIVIKPENLDKTHKLELTLSWNRKFGFYYLDMSAGYLKHFVKSSYIDSETRFIPAFITYIDHIFTISPHINAGIYTFYHSPFYYYNAYQRQYYSITAQLSFNLLKNRLNILINGLNLLNGGNYYSKDKYKHTVSICESNYHPRGISIGISYNFNNFMDLFQKNESGSDMIKRAKID